MNRILMHVRLWFAAAFAMAAVNLTGSATRLLQEREYLALASLKLGTLAPDNALIAERMSAMREAVGSCGFHFMHLLVIVATYRSVRLLRAGDGQGVCKQAEQPDLQV
jgi:hypothetical protein